MSYFFNKKRLGPRSTLDKGTFQVGFYVYYSSNSTKKFDKWDWFSNYLLINNAYSKIPKLYGMYKITIEEGMDKLDVFLYRFGKINGFGWWDLERILADAGT